MAKTSKIVNGLLELTETGEAKIITMSRKDVVGERDKAQTEVDHLKLNLADAELVVSEWDDYIKEIDK
jgi:hypothetical protein